MDTERTAERVIDRKHLTAHSELGDHSRFPEMCRERWDSVKFLGNPKSRLAQEGKRTREERTWGGFN